MELEFDAGSLLEIMDDTMKGFRVFRTRRDCLHATLKPLLDITQRIIVACTSCADLVCGDLRDESDASKTDFKRDDDRHGEFREFMAPIFRFLCQFAAVAA